MRSDRLVCVLIIALVLGKAHALAPLSLSADELSSIATHKATCPFIGSLVRNGLIDIYNSKDAPLAHISEVVAYGNTGGADLGNLLFVFATGNHAYTLAYASATSLTQETPLGYFALDFPGSQGSHFGHSGILMGDHRVLNSGRWSQSNWNRLTAKATYYNGEYYLKTSSIGHFISDDLHLDPNSDVGLLSVLKLAGQFATTLGPALLSQARSASNSITESGRDSLIALTKTLGANNLIGSSGEFGLLLAFLSNSPNSINIGGELAVSLTEVSSMFHFTFPTGWQSWPKKITDWAIHTTALATSAAKAYITSKRALRATMTGKLLNDAMATSHRFQSKATQTGNMTVCKPSFVTLPPTEEQLLNGLNSCDAQSDFIDLSDLRLQNLPAGVFNRFTHVSMLALSGNALSSLPPGIFSSISNKLTWLYLAGNAFSTLSTGMFDGLAQVTMLWLGHQQPGLSALPAGIFNQMPKLAYLYLDSNSLSSVPADAFALLPELLVLHLGQNRLTSLPGGLLDASTSLRWLNLADNNLTSWDASLFAHSSALMQLYVQGNHLSEVPPGILQFAPNFTMLDLMYNSLQSAAGGVTSGFPPQVLLAGNPGYTLESPKACQEPVMQDAFEGYFEFHSPAGFPCSSAAAASLSPCSAGAYSDGYHPCLPCAAGSYSNTSAASSCFACTENGFFCSEGATAPTRCSSSCCTPSQDSDCETHSNGAVVAAIVVGALAFVGLVVSAAWWRKQKAPSSNDTGPQSEMYESLVDSDGMHAL